jgi:serine phosphatase RsbU (regulator of sigma subunit)
LGEDVMVHPALLLGLSKDVVIRLVLLLNFGKDVENLSEDMVGRQDLVGLVSTCYHLLARDVSWMSTLFVARLDHDSGRLDYCTAGHPPASLLRAEGQLELLSEGGPVLGVVPSASFDRGSVQLAAGDLLLACSDGILESFNEADQEFGTNRLEAELRRAQGGSAESVLFSVLGAVQDFAAPRPLTDDMTLVIVKSKSREFSH